MIENRIKRAIAAMLVVTGFMSLASCSVDSHTPEMELAGDIVRFEIEGQLGATALSSPARTVEFTLSEVVDMRNAVVSELELSEGARLELSDGTPVEKGSVIDISQAQKMILRTRAGYDWTVRARQNIAYRFRVSGKITPKIGRPARDVSQVGESYFEESSRRVFAYVPEGTDMMNINIDELKLAPEGVPAVYEPSLDVLLNEPQAFRLSSYESGRVRHIRVTCRGITSEWSLYLVESDVQVASVDPFAGRAYITGFGSDKDAYRFEYRAALGYDSSLDPEAQGWLTIPDEMMTVSEQPGVFTATLKGLTPDTDYLVRAISGENTSEAVKFRTGKTKELPQAGFEDWRRGVDDRKSQDPSLFNVDSWCPWPEGAVWRVNRWWDTGNKGITKVDIASGGNSLATAPGEGCPAYPEGRAAKLQTVYTYLAGGKTAGGNIYFGEFGEMYSLNASCRLGHNWSDAKPTGMKGWFKYFPQPIDQVSAAHAAHHPMGLLPGEWLGRPDELHVCVALWASPDGRDVPFEVDTRTDSHFLDFSKDKPGVIAYGAFVSSDRQESWAEFTVEMEYLPEYWEKYSVKTGGKLPANTQLYLLITSSKHCNYFIAGTGTGVDGDPTNDVSGSTMYVDELKLLYE